MPEILIAMDKSARRIDENGYLHVAMSNISKADISPYFGREVPEWKTLGLDPNKTYQLFRDPDELRKGMDTFNNMPIMLIHVLVSAGDPHSDYRCGTTGTDANFSDPYLRNSLTLWDQDAIDLVEDEEQDELSCSYRYDADMTPGTYKGLTYDGVMRQIRANHVALVKKGRAGPDVVVADSTLGETGMSTAGKKVLSRRAIMLHGALTAYLAPKLAMDAQIKLIPIVSGVTTKGWKAQRPKLIATLNRTLTGKLAADADLDDLVTLLDTLDSGDMTDMADDDAPEELADEDMADDADDMAGLRAFLKAKGMKDEDIEAACTAAKPPAAAADENAEVVAQKPVPSVSDLRGTSPAKGIVTKAAMDAAIEKNSAATIKRMNALHRAAKEVEPYIGDVDVLAMDSADEVYKLALEALDVDISDMHPSAYGAVLKHLPKPGASVTGGTVVAMDAKPIRTGLAARFPGVYGKKKSA